MGKLLKGTSLNLKLYYRFHKDLNSETCVNGIDVLTLTPLFPADNSASGAATAANEIFWRFWPSRLSATLGQMTKLRINRQLAGAAAFFAALVLGPLAHQIINCQYTKPATVTATATPTTGLATGTGRAKVPQQRQQQQKQQPTKQHQQMPGSTNRDEKDVTASKAPPFASASTSTSTSSVKCFYNCQMAVPTENRNLALHEDDDDGVANIESATAAAPASDIAAAVAAGVASCSIKRLSATLVGSVEGVASWLDQRILMTLRRQPMDGTQTRWSACWCRIDDEIHFRK